MIAGSLAQLIDYLIIGMACWKVGGVFNKNSRLTSHLAERFTARTTAALTDTPLVRHGHRLSRNRVALVTDTGVRQETFYDLYQRPRHTVRTGAPRILMIYHHGMGEIPHDHTFHNIFFGPDPIVGVDLISLKATYHPPHFIPTPDSAYLADAATWIEMMADSLALASHIEKRFRPDYDGIFLGGISQGGLITYAALAYHDVFDLYHPMMIGPNLPEQLRLSIFMHFTRPDVIEALKHDPFLNELNFLPVVAKHIERVQLIVGEHDPVFRIEPIRALMRDLPALDVSILPNAHITGCLAGEGIRAALFRRWRRWAGPAGSAGIPGLREFKLLPDAPPSTMKPDENGTVMAGTPTVPERPA